MNEDLLNVDTYIEGSVEEVRTDIQFGRNYEITNCGSVKIRGIDYTFSDIKADIQPQMYLKFKSLPGHFCEHIVSESLIVLNSGTIQK